MEEPKLVIVDQNAISAKDQSKLELLGFTVITKTAGSICEVIFPPRKSASAMKAET